MDEEKAVAIKPTSGTIENGHVHVQNGVSKGHVLANSGLHTKGGGLTNPSYTKDPNDKPDVNSPI